jgi:SAM-dependent methyltransferase
MDWESRKSVAADEGVLFRDMFSRYLEDSQGKRCLEIGCVPGGFLGYICKNFGYFPEGIDNVKGTKEITEETLKNYGLNEYSIYQEDFLAWKPNKKYHLVCSFGFIEHFAGETLARVIQKHIEIIEPGGKLIIDVPNFRYGQYALRYPIDKKILDEHNLDIMNLEYFNKIAQDFNLKILCLGYTGGFFDFWVENRHKNFFQRVLFRIIQGIKSRISRSKLRDINNKYFSPFIIFIAEK